MYPYLNRLERMIREQQFAVRRAGYEDLKRILAVYFAGDVISEGYDDFDGQKWLRVAATAVLDNNIAAQTHMLDAYPSLKAMYQPGDGNTEVYYLKDVTATFSSFTEAPVVINF